MTTAEKADNIISSLQDYYKEGGVTDISLTGLKEKPYRTFSVDFMVYNFFPMRLNYEGDDFGMSVMCGRKGMRIKTPNQWNRYDDVKDWREYWKKVDEDLRMRVLDEVLKAQSWENEKKILTAKKMKDNSEYYYNYRYIAEYHGHKEALKVKKENLSLRCHTDYTALELCHRLFDNHRLKIDKALITYRVTAPETFRVKSHLLGYE